MNPFHLCHLWIEKVPSKPTHEFRALKEKALEMFAAGLSVSAVAAQLDVALRTAYEWRGVQHPKGPRPVPSAVVGQEPAPATPSPPRRRLTEMVREEAVDVTRVLLDQAKAGDVRAATLVVRLLEKVVGEEEVERDDLRELAESELERELESLPAAIASEIVGLLAKAERELQGARADAGQTAGGGDVRSRRVPWQPGGESPDAGEDAL